MIEPVFIPVKELRPWGHHRNTEYDDYLALLQEDEDYEKYKIRKMLKKQLKKKKREKTLKNHQE